MRSDELRRFSVLKNSVMICPGCFEKIVITNLDQALKAAKRHTKRHAEAEANVVRRGDWDGLASVEFSNMSGDGLRRQMEGMDSESTNSDHMRSRIRRPASRRHASSVPASLSVPEEGRRYRPRMEDD